MSKKSINFDDKKIKKVAFTKTKKYSRQITYVIKCVNKILVSRKEPHVTKNSFKYFIGYNDNDVIRPLCVGLPQMTGYARKFMLYLVSRLCFFDNKLIQWICARSFFIYNKKKYKTPFLSTKLELFIMLIASSLLIYQKLIL